MLVNFVARHARRRLWSSCSQLLHPCRKEVRRLRIFHPFCNLVLRSKVLPLDVKEGDRIVFNKYAGTEIKTASGEE